MATTRTLRPIRPQYPIWRIRSIALVSLLVVALIATLVFVIGQKSAFIKAEITLGLAAAALMLFLAVGLYRGVRVREASWNFSWPDHSNLLDGVSSPDFSWTPDIDVGDGCLGAILGLVAAVFLGIALVLVAWLLVSMIWALWLVLSLALFWVFNRALRTVFAHAPACHGNLPLSLRYATLYTLLYTSWLFALIWAIGQVTR